MALRPITSPGPGADPEALRAAYLGLLKLALCDLVGTATTSVEGLPGGEVASRELRGEELTQRAAGKDWPLHGLTMTGLRRLDDLQSCVESVVRDRVEGDLIETGSWRGGSSLLMRATLDTLGERERTVWVADSFAGFPEIDPERPPTTFDAATVLHAFDFLVAHEEDVRETFSRLGLGHGTRLLPGLFAQTLPGLVGHRWSLVRLDGDSYAATKVALDCLYPSLAVGGHLIVDDYGSVEECRAAVEDFRRKHEIGEPLEQIDWTCVRWRRESEAFANPSEPPAPAPARQSVTAPGPAKEVPTRTELALRARLSALEARLAEALRTAAQLERELHAITDSRSWRMTRPIREAKRLRSIRRRG